MSTERLSHTVSLEPQTNGDADAVTAEEIADAFAVSERRAVLRHLDDAGTSVELDDLARLVAGHECDTPPDEVPPERYERTLVDLHDDHLPMLESFGFVDVERTDGVYVTGDDSLAAVF